MTKRILSMLLAALLLCGSLTALAETKATTVNASDVSVSRYSDRLIVTRDKAVFLTDPEGNKLSGDYDYISENYDAPVYVVRALTSEDGVNREGVIDADGNVLVPAEYGDTDVLSERWQLGIKIKESTEDSCDYTVSNWSTGAKSFWLIDYADVWYCGRKIGTLSRSDYQYAYAFGDYFIVRDRTNSAYSAYDKAFNRSPYVVNGSSEFDSQYKSGKTLYYHQGSGQQAFCAGCTLDPDEVEACYAVEDGKVLNLQGEVVATLKQEYDNFYRPVAGPYAVAKANGKKGVIDLRTGEEIIPTEYDDIRSYYYDVNDGTGYACAVKDGKIGYVRGDGTVTCDFVYAESAAHDYGLFSYVKDLTGGVIVLSAQAGILPDHYADVSMRNGARAFTAENEQKQSAVVGLNGQFLVPYGEYKYAYVNNDATVAVAYVGSREYALWTMDYEDATAGGPEPSGEASGVTCPGCGASYAAGEVPNFCPACGTKLG